MAKPTDALVELLSTITGVEGVKIDLTEETVVESPEGEVETSDLDPEEEMYSQVTYLGMKRYRPDLLAAIALKLGVMRSRGNPDKKPARILIFQPGETKAEHFVRYLAMSRGMFDKDPASVTERRLVYLRNKYLLALEEAGVQLTANQRPTFMITNTIVMMWEGGRPAKIPDELIV